MPQTLIFSSHYLCATQCLTIYIFQTINSVRANNLSLKYERFTPAGCKDIGIRKVEFKYPNLKSNLKNFSRGLNLNDLN